MNTATIVGDFDAATLDQEPNDEFEQVAQYTFRAGGSFILDTPADPEPIWGSGADVLLADGEALIIAGGQGLGKTTLAQQLALGLIGIPEYADLLGYPVTPVRRRVLYLAMDRPKQAARSFRRMVGEAMRAELNARLAVWQGPPPYDLARYPALLLRLCEEAQADAVVIDSLKDAAVGLNDDGVGAGYNRARQTAITAGVQVVELHHNRKAPNGAKVERPSIDNLYGSTWLTSGAGSVLLLTGDPGDPIVGLHHVKQPDATVGPFKVIHDQETGRSQVWQAADLVMLAGQPGGITALDAAKVLFECDRPSPAERQKALRRLNRHASSGELMKAQGDQTKGEPDRFLTGIQRAA